MAGKETPSERRKAKHTGGLILLSVLRQKRPTVLNMKTNGSNG